VRAASCVPVDDRPMQLARRHIEVALVLALLGLGIGVADAQGAAFFGATSPFNRPAASAVDGGSAQAVASLLSSGQGVNVNTGAWTPTVFYAAPSSPLGTFRMSNGSRLQIPIPAGAIASSDSDGPMEIVDRRHGCIYDFAGAVRGGDGSWSAVGAAVFRLDGSGVHRPWAVRASGFSLGAGLIRPAEVRAGVIKHALLMAIPMTSTAFVAPATTTDGHDPNGVRMGSHLQLDPHFDLSVLPPDQRPIARAMQRYGIYIGDTSSAITLFAQNTNSVRGFSYPQSWSSGLSHAREILSSLRLLAPGPAPQLDSSPLRQCTIAPKKRKH
jgi:hypothetical protein